jgi:hypothetical protein
LLQPQSLPYAVVSKLIEQHRFGGREFWQVTYDLTFFNALQGLMGQESWAIHQEGFGMFEMSA